MKKKINGFRMNYEDVGDGPALIFVHGFPLDHTMWSHQVKALSDDYRVITPDLRGHGQSEAPPSPYRMDQMADDVRGLLQALDVERAVLVGLSMGGYIAFAFWRIYPHLVRALVLADTRAAADTPDARLNRQAMIDQVKAAGTEPIVEEMLPKLLSPATLKNKAEVVAHTQRMMAGTPAPGVIGALHGLAERPDSTRMLRTLAVPTLILVGEDDAITPPADAEAMQRAILSARRPPNVSLVRIPDAGHLAPLENPTAVNQALREFLASLPD